VVATPARTPAPELLVDAGRDGVRAPIDVEAGEIEPEPLGRLPQVRVLEPPLIGEERVVHRPEGALETRRLGARAAASARGWAARTGKWRNTSRASSSARRATATAQNGHS